MLEPRIFTFWDIVETRYRISVVANNFETESANPSLTLIVTILFIQEKIHEKKS